MRLNAAIWICLLSGSLAHAHEGSDKYRYSVFTGIHQIQPATPAHTTILWSSLQHHFPSWNMQTDRLNHTLRDAFGPGLSIPGNTPSEKLSYCFNTQLPALGILASEWTEVRNEAASHATYIDFEQILHGHKVTFSRLSFRFTPDGKLVRIKMKDYGDPQPDKLPVLSKEDAKAVALQGVEHADITETLVADDWEWFPIPTASGYELVPAWSFSINGQDKSWPLELRGYVDAINGKLLYRTNLVKDNANKTVVGQVYTQNPQQPSSVMPLPHLMIAVGSDPYYTDANGVFEESALSLPLTADVLLRGKWSSVRAANAGGVIPVFSNTITTNGTTYEFPVTAPSSERHVNAYYHVNVVHDFMKTHLPTFQGLDLPLRTNVDVSGTCNAFFTSSGGGSINFYQANAQCNSFALCGDIVYHEYGHAIAHYFYNWQGAGYMQNGALNEGQADIWGISITENPILGLGAYANSGGYIRRYDGAPKVYPIDINGEVHNDGEIIAGAWWDVAQNIGSVQAMTEIFTKTFFDLPDGPDGTEGDVFYDVLISALMNDDTDGDLTNGTPHFDEIVAAFARHGIYLLQYTSFLHEELAHAPAQISVPVQAEVVSTVPAFLGNVFLYYKERGNNTWNPLQMTQTTGNHYEAVIPGLSEGSLVDYYFTAYDNTPNAVPNVFSPHGFYPDATSSQSVLINIPYQFGFGIGTRHKEDFESALSTDWQIGVASDNATGGRWVHASPVGSFVDGVPVQPGADHTTGTAAGKCLVTGNAPSTSSPAGTADVDNGVTTVITPLFDLSEYTNPIVEYYRWYSNDLGSNPRNDQWEVQIRNSASALWRYVDRTNHPDTRWRRRIFSLQEYYSVPVQQLMMRFIASDKVVPSASGDGQSLVEAAVDDLFIYDNASTITSVGEIPVPERAQVFPNPASDKITIETPSYASGYIALYDLAGRELIRTEMTGQQKSYMLSVKHLVPGIYQVRIQSGKNIQLTKITIAH